MLASGHDPDAGFDGWTPLMLAAMNGEKEIARVLIEAGANVNMQSDEYGSALGVAAMSPFFSGEDETAIVRLLVENGAELDIGNGADMTPLMFAAREGKYETMLYLIEAGADVNRQDVRGWSPLMFAVRTGLPNVVALMLEAGADPNVREEYPFQTPLHHAVSSGVPEIVAFLLDAGAEANGLYEGGGYNLPPIFTAVAEERTEIVRLLLNHGANPNYSDGGNLSESDEDYTLRTPLEWARKSGNEEIEEMLVEAGAMTQEELDEALLEMLRAIEEGDAERFGELVATGVDPRISAPTVEGEIDLLEKAAARGRTEIVGMILDGWEINQFRLENAYHAAFVPGQEEVIDLLIAKRPGEMLFAAIAVDDPEFLFRILTQIYEVSSYRDQSGVNVIYAAAEAGNPEMVRMLLEAGALPGDISGWGETAIFGAIKQGRTEIVAMLLEADPALTEMPNRTGMTPLAMAVRLGETESARMLIEAGADLEYYDRWGWTPLHHAAWMGSYDCVQLLLDVGADREARIPTGERALELAETAENPEVVELLR